MLNGAMNWLKLFHPTAELSDETPRKGIHLRSHVKLLLNLSLVYNFSYNFLLDTPKRPKSVWLLRASNRVNPPLGSSPIGIWSEPLTCPITKKTDLKVLSQILPLIPTFERGKTLANPVQQTGCLITISLCITLYHCTRFAVSHQQSPADSL